MMQKVAIVIGLLAFGFTCYRAGQWERSQYWNNHWQADAVKNGVAHYDAEGNWKWGR